MGEDNRPYYIIFPENYSVKYGEKTYKPDTNVGIYYLDKYRIDDGEFEDGAIALMVTGINKKTKAIEVKGENTETGEGLDWSNAVPTAANAGEYTVFYKAVKGDESSPVGSVTATIAKGNPLTTAPTAKADLKYTGTEQPLVSELQTGTLQGAKVYMIENLVYAPEMSNKVNYKFYTGNDELLPMTNKDRDAYYTDGYDFSLRDYLDLTKKCAVICI